MYPQLILNTEKLYHNAKSIVRFCGQHGLDVLGVTKVVKGHPRVAQAMLEAGVKGLADSRLDNIQRLRDHKIEAPILCLRGSSFRSVKDMVRLADASLNSELDIIKAIDEEARFQKKKHEVILMVDLGDLREGVLPSRLPALVEEVLTLSSICLVGIGANLACYGGVMPSATNMTELAELARSLFPSQDCVVSCGNSSALHLMKKGGWVGPWTQPLNQLRIGESILLGWDITDKTPLLDCSLEACLVEAEIIEVQEKPSVPKGEIGPDAFGNIPTFTQRGTHKRMILALGKQDLGAGALLPLQEGIEVLGSSSDHVLVHCDQGISLHVGERLTFRVDYGALLALSHSASVSVSLV